MPLISSQAQKLLSDLHRSGFEQPIATTFFQGAPGRPTLGMVFSLPGGQINKL